MIQATQSSRPRTENGHVPQSYFLDCGVEKGIFIDELTILIEGVEGYFEAFIDRRLVERHGEEGRRGFVRVKIVESDPTNHTVLVEMPVPRVMGSSRLWVHEKSLISRN